MNSIPSGEPGPRMNEQPTPVGMFITNAGGICQINQQSEELNTSNSYRQ